VLPNYAEDELSEDKLERYISLPNFCRFCPLKSHGLVKHHGKEVALNRNSLLQNESNLKGT
jgi:hypothetical protein